MILVFFVMSQKKEAMVIIFCICLPQVLTMIFATLLPSAVMVSF